MPDATRYRHMCDGYNTTLTILPAVLDTDYRYTAGHRASISVRYRGGSPISSFGSNRGSIRPRYRAFENRGPILGKARYRGQRTKCGSYQKLMTGRSRSCLSSCWQTDSLATYERCKIRVGYALEDRRWIRIGYTLDTHWICVGYVLDTRWIRVGYALDALAHTSVYSHIRKW